MSAFQPFKFLIVEDNVIFRSSFREMLSARFPGAGIEEAGDAEEALEKYENTRPDLIFMDIKLPGKNGLEVTRTIKSGDAGAVIIILTSYDILEYREAAFGCGASHFFIKGNTKSDDIAAVVRSELSAMGKERRC